MWALTKLGIQNAVLYNLLADRIVFGRPRKHQKAGVEAHHATFTVLKHQATEKMVGDSKQVFWPSNLWDDDGWCKCCKNWLRLWDCFKPPSSKCITLELFHNRSAQASFGLLQTCEPLDDALGVCSVGVSRNLLWQAGMTKYLEENCTWHVNDYMNSNLHILNIGWTTLQIGLPVLLFLALSKAPGLVSMMRGCWRPLPARREIDKIQFGIRMV